MTTETDVSELDLSDAELMEVLKNHGISRRGMMKLLGAGAGAAAISGTAAGKPGKGTRIDKIYGASYAAGVHNVPSGLVDHSVDLHIHDSGGDHPGFPVDPNENEAPEFFFDPVGLHVKPGEIVEFITHGIGLHTVTAFDPKFNEPPFLFLPDRVPTDYGFTSPPVAEDDSWLYKFTVKGVYDLFCLPHLTLGMVMRVVVFDPEEDDIGDPTFDEPGGDDALPPFANMVLSNGVLDPADIVDAGEVAWSDLTLPLPL